MYKTANRFSPTGAPDQSAAFLAAKGVKRKKGEFGPPPATPLAITLKPGEQLPASWRKEAALAYPRLREIRPLLERLTERIRKAGTLADRLNERRIPNAIGTPWTPGGATALVQRLGLVLGRKAQWLQKRPDPRPNPQPRSPTAIDTLSIRPPRRDGKA